MPGAIATRGSRDELGRLVTEQSIANERATLGMFGSGFIEMLARQMTAELQAIRDSTAPVASRLLVTKGVSFGVIDIVRFAGGKVVEHWGQMDSLRMMQQLGVIPAPGAGEG